MKTFGLTGGIGTGKSTVARYLRERYRVPIVDADQVARAVVALGSPALADIATTFGPESLTPEGTLDRPKMRARIMNNAEDRRKLEEITHPRIREAINEWREAQSAPLIGVEDALMVETGSWRLYDELVVVTTTPETQLRRVVERDRVSETDAHSVLAVQLPMSEKEKVATVLIRNDADLDALFSNVDEAWETLSRPRG